MKLLDYAEKHALPFYGEVPKGMSANLEYRDNLIRECVGNVDLQKQVMAACREDFLFWLNTFAWTYDPRISERGDSTYGGLGSNLPFISWPFQDEAALEVIRCIDDGEDCVILKSRDMGASWLLLMVATWYWLFFTGKSFLLISRKKEYVDSKKPGSMMWKIDFCLKHLPPWMKPWDFNRVDMHIGNGDNGSVIDGETQTKDAGRADRLTCVIPDEFASFLDGYAVDAATTDTTRCRIFNSTPKGQGNCFADKAHDPNINKIKMMWWQHPVKRRGLYRAKDGKVQLFDNFPFPRGYKFIADGNLRSPWYDMQCERFSHPQLRAQELDCDFFASDFQFFDPAVLQGILTDICRPAVTRGRFTFDTDSLDDAQFIPNHGESSEGAHAVFESWKPIIGQSPPDPSLTYVIGCDIAAGTGATRSVASVGCVETGELIGQYANAHITPKDFAKLCVALCRFYRGGDNTEGAFLIWEGNGPGATFTKTVLESGYRNIYYRPQDELGIKAKKSQKPGWWARSETTLELMTSYAEAMKSRDVVVKSKESIEDCRLWVYGSGGLLENKLAKNDIDPTAARDNHSDRVVANALMWRAIKDKKVDVAGDPLSGVVEGTMAHRQLVSRLQQDLGDSVEIEVAELAGGGWNG